ncbi:DUF2087 domain-containing protein [Paenibacillus allorhizosphaerae]|uniref:DUF2087 domain-containing protein n=1 Tax=Paenibacillus allorhizosphaerae TaxID=2849866 RepID=A0ABN7TK95_9BACL|nr:DUF2087 domain-containing protein [Paenibacillus allorhizosphaerae]CAG7642941.1 hypothetical protein PAECIP111802_02925 [Paenibacillus allorhizosphaerae]
MNQDHNIDPLFVSSMQELKRGYGLSEESDRYFCLVCGYETEQGVIYAAPDGSGYRDAEKQMKEHIAAEHGSMFHYLLTLDKKRTGLSHLQRQLLLLFYEGVSDADVVRRTGAGSASTIRNHRFVLREKEKQARLFLALMELFQEKTGSETDRASKSKTAKGQHPGTVDGEDAPEASDGPLQQWPNKESKRKEIAGSLQRRFRHGTTYTEPEVNAILEQVWPDYAVLRRYMVEYGYLLRKDDGSAYWLPDESGMNGVDGVDVVNEPDTSKQRRKELIAAYEEKERTGGVFLLRNKRNGKIGIGSNPNIEGAINRIKFELSIGRHRDPSLQQDWNDGGEAGFEFEVLEKLNGREGSMQDVRKTLAGMEATWLEKLHPYGERGYNGSADNKQKI